MPDYFYISAPFELS